MSFLCLILASILYAPPVAVIRAVIRKDSEKVGDYIDSLTETSDFVEIANVLLDKYNVSLKPTSMDLLMFYCVLLSIKVIFLQET
jgi:hypothetical protein